MKDVAAYLRALLAPLTGDYPEMPLPVFFGYWRHQFAGNPFCIVILAHVALRLAARMPRTHTK